jgi:SAM-dependent methyltransferase
MNNNFDKYAYFYDYFNVGKDYRQEVYYINDLIKKFNTPTHTILDIGCGTGLHDIELAKLKYDVTGLDISNEMIYIAKSRNTFQDSLSFIADPELTFNSITKYDTIISLFHVTSYQSNAEKLDSFFDIVSRNVKNGGIFIFDYWFTPAVESLKLQERKKSVFINGKEFQKVSKPSILETNLFQIDITISSDDLLFTESHFLRSFVPDDFSKITGFKLLESYTWMQNSNPDPTNWSAVSILQKNE